MNVFITSNPSVMHYWGQSHTGVIVGLPEFTLLELAYGYQICSKELLTFVVPIVVKYHAGDILGQEVNLPRNAIFATELG